MLRVLMGFTKQLICISALLIFFGSLTAAIPSAKFVVFTPPKCGTHLVCNVLGYMLGSAPLITDKLETPENTFELVENANKNNQFLVSHSFTSEMLDGLILRGYKIIFILRDPRDQLISMMYWMKKGYWNEFTVSKISDINEQIEELITGERLGWRCYEDCIGYRLAMVQALKPEDVFITSFERLVGPKGGGLHDVQIDEIINISRFLDVKISYELAEDIALHSFGGTWSFREGKIGSWKTHFLPAQKELYKALYSQILIDLGYEQGVKWQE